MNKNLLLDAVGEVDDEYIASALSRLEDNSRQIKRHHHAFSRKAFAGIAIFAILLVSSFTVAMAANRDFRNAIFRFLRISTPDTVLPAENEPDKTGKMEIIGNGTIEDTVYVQYIRGDGIFDYSEGVIYLYDEAENPAGAYSVTNGQLSCLEPHGEAFEYTWNDMTYQIRFDWYKEDDHIHASESGFDLATYAGWNVAAAKGNSDFVILTLSCGSQIEYEQYPLLYNLKTREVLDILGPCEALGSLRITETRFSPDLSKILITCDFGSMVYYYDVAAQTLQPLNELCGMNAARAWFIDNDTLCCISMDESRKYTCRTVVIPDGKYFEIFSAMPCLGQSSDTGIIFTGGKYGLFVDGERSTYVYDLKTGNRAIVKDFKYPPDNAYTTIINNAENKILFVRHDAGTDSRGYSEIGILDLEEQSFILFEREGYETRREHAISWFDDDRVAIWASTEENWYLYLFTVKTGKDD